jgi:hypothetical protein
VWGGVRPKVLYEFGLVNGVKTAASEAKVGQIAGVEREKRVGWLCEVGLLGWGLSGVLGQCGMKRRPCQGRTHNDNGFSNWRNLKLCNKSCSAVRLASARVSAAPRCLRCGRHDTRSGRCHPECSPVIPKRSEESRASMTILLAQVWRRATSQPCLREGHSRRRHTLERALTKKSPAAHYGGRTCSIT